MTMLLVDIEWIEEGTGLILTQLAAVRVTGDWKSVAEYQCLVCPPHELEPDWEHVAYRGYSPDEFRAGIDEKDCVRGFARFLRKDDIICCWHKDTKRLLQEKYELYQGCALPNQFVSVNRKIYTLARRRKIEARGLYAAAEAFGIQTVIPEHRSTNDVFVMRCLLSHIGYSQIGIPDRLMKSSQQLRREKNLDILSRVQYHYVFIPNSSVFHTPSCKLLLNAKTIQGCTYYKVAAKTRRPCKVCHPEQVKYSKPVEVRTVRKDNAVQRPEKKIVTAKLLGHLTVEISNDKIVGCCHHSIHPGKLTRKLLLEHNCIGKNCNYFEKYAESKFWVAEENKKREKEKRKEARRDQKQAARKLEDELKDLQRLFQSYVDDAGYSMLIVVIEKEDSNNYRVFFVSDYPYADGNRYPGFIQAVRFFFPEYHIQLRHIRDVDGHFVTTAEYLSRKGKKW